MSRHMGTITFSDNVSEILVKEDNNEEQLRRENDKLREDIRHLREYKDEELKSRSRINLEFAKMEFENNLRRYGPAITTDIRFSAPKRGEDFEIDLNQCRGAYPCKHIVRWYESDTMRYTKADLLCCTEIVKLCKEHDKYIPFHFMIPESTDVSKKSDKKEKKTKKNKKEKK